MAGTYTKLFYHIVFSTKNRERFITPTIEDELHKYISGVVRGIGGTIVEINGMPDHVHILAILPPKMRCAISRQTPQNGSMRQKRASADSPGRTVTAHSP
jgi:REP element-mobilizing transposase RayT